MKRQYYILTLLLILTSASLRAQHINTMYFLENAPLRHTINPAFQPVSKVYIALPVIGGTNLTIGNNGISMQDLIFKNPDGQTVTALHPSAEGLLWDKMPNLWKFDTDINLNFIGVGRRIKENGYLTLNASAHVIAGIGLPKSLLSPLLGQSIENLNLKTLNASATIYSDIAIGYSHKINDQWSVGGKLKLLMGMAHMSGQFDEFAFNSNTNTATLRGTGSLRQAGILDMRLFMGGFEEDMDTDDDFYTDESTPMDENAENEALMNQIMSYIKPQGYGGAIDLGFTYKPVKQLQFAVSVTDLGLMHWHTGSIGAVSVDTTFTGVANFNYSDYVVDGQFQSELLKTDVQTSLEKYGNAIHVEDIMDKAFNQMLTANLNVGIDANFWKNRIGIGVYSHTRFFNMLNNFYATEEITFGAAFRPANWFNLALSYSFMNGNWSNAGAAISLAPYDGLMLTVAADYVPLTFADYPINESQIIPLPYKTSMVNLSFGLAIVVGTNPKKKHKLQEEQ